ncbi:MAG: septum site-determining protein MinC [Buchnera aphidicola (Nurudea shiraii)]
MKSSPLELKENVFKILVLYLHTDSTELISRELTKKVNMSPIFFKNLPIIVNLKKIFNIENWNSIKKIITSFNFYILGVSNCYSTVLKTKIEESGLPVFLKEKSLVNYISKNKLNNINAINLNMQKKTKIVSYPIRSGQKIYSANSDLIIINNVSPGAEIIADGNIHIYGIIRGRVLAGAQGDTTCQIFCIKFFAELISIAGKYLLSDQFLPDILGKSVRIYIKDKKLNILKFS